VKSAYLLTIALKDAWKQKLSLSILASCCIIGTAALLAIGSIKDNLQSLIDINSKSLLGADFSISSRHSPDEDIKSFISSIPEILQLKTSRANETSFASMVFFKKSERSRLVQISAISSSYPLYGSLDTNPENAIDFLTSQGNALLDLALKTQFNLEVGDQILLGKISLTIQGFIRLLPGTTEARSALAPRILISEKDLHDTELLKKGSIARYHFLFKIHPSYSIEEIKDTLKNKVTELNLSIETHEDKSESLKKNLKVLSHFFDGITLLSFLLGAIGIVSGAFIYLQRKKTFLETLRYLGLTHREASLISGIQIISFGLIGISIGIILGFFIQCLLPQILAVILPVEVPFFISWKSVSLAVLGGILVLISFTLVSSYLNKPYSHTTLVQRRFLSLFVSACLVYFWIFLIIGSAFSALIYLLVYLILCGGIVSAGLLLRRIARKVSNVATYFTIQQGIKNLYRPNNQTMILLLSIGISSFAVSSILIIKDLTISKLTLLNDEDNGNMLLFDIQTDQEDNLLSLLESHSLPVIAKVPVVQMRMTKINGIRIDKIRSNPLTNKDIPDWLLTREYRSTYRNHLEETETLIEGTYTSDFLDDNTNAPVPVSVEKGIMEKIGLSLGDTIHFSVQGVEIETIVKSVRKVDWQQLKPNFFILFPIGVLEDAPQNFIVLSRYLSSKQNTEFQNEVVLKFGNISVVDLELILSTVRNITRQLQQVVIFLSFIVLISSFVILVGLIWGSRATRIEENILLRTLGANAKTIYKILICEYLALATLGSLSGLLFSVGASYLFSFYTLQVPYTASWLTIFGSTIVTILAIVILGMLGAFGTIKKASLESFRLLEE
jgi:putative ABC transport system permease protein